MPHLDQPSRDDHPAVRRVEAALAAADSAGAIVTLVESARTAQAAADALGCPVGAIANSLIFDADGEPLLVLTSGAHRADTGLLATLVEAAAVRRATPDFVREHTGQAIGGVAPVGHPVPIRTLVDTALASYDQIWAAAGHPHRVFPTTYAELLMLTGGQPAEVAAPG